MEAQSKPGRWTYAEFARLPSEGSTRYEVIAGDLVVTPAPSLRHQRVVGALVTRLTAFVRTHGLGEVYPGPVDVLFAEGDYVEPDVVFVGNDHRDYLTDRGIEGPPDRWWRSSRRRRRTGTGASSWSATDNSACRSTG